MRFDIISTFPEFFAALDLSLVGKAQKAGVVDIRVHNLRDWAEGKHLAVDDTPTGGGAGMVMRPDVWGRALDTVLEEGAVLAIPTPSGKPLTQRDLEALVQVPQIVVACGRYEGIDARVAEHYGAEGIRVFEYSLGDYVLNGGEVAAVALVEGVSRLVDGMVGNPESLVEESHSVEGLLEYPVYTQPREWRGIETPAVLFSGDHARIRRWRRDRALARTADRRPDMINALVEGGKILERADVEVLTSRGVDVRTGRWDYSFSVAEESDLSEVAALAARTFPLACPPTATETEIREHIDTHLTENAFRELTRGGASITTVRSGPELVVVAYALCEPNAPDDIASLSPGACYVSKIYTDPEFHGSGVSGALMEFALADAVSRWGSTAVLLGTNQSNRRAIRFYRRHGFKKCGRRTFEVGKRIHRDFVYVRDLTVDPPR
ncbi:tRNA (guanosine(37)-N1)-methyltransferase TrmD [Actinomyces minihominis]|uniref:tRNA (guanosine(37)-N1)-methyltransferase TrmD n=1 Tax=Actinomyces minihominis TaxID=2002838 RepID=UPI000C083C71|nr:tRNA (guanosine(37)-N1)-methyltransferase TrmD [Actinomyces minihominis]